MWGFLLLDMWVRLILWSTSLAFSTAAFTALGVWPEGNPLDNDLGTTIRWAQGIAKWVLLFNVVYLLELLLLRLPIPTPQEGTYSTTKRGLPDRQLIWTTLLGILTKARYQAPFPGFLVFHLANLPPLCWLAGPIFGPKSKSCYATEPEILDPSLVEVGRNVIIGYGTRIVGHMQEADHVTIRRTVIEDDVLIGGEASILAGAHLGKGCVIGSRALVLPGTVVGPYEIWVGAPAKKIGMVHPENAPESA
jgi:acetyltransferase-like isoleucine patch superfamily enzyme